MNTTDRPAYGLSPTLGSSFEDAIACVREVFKEEGFGVLSERNVQQTLQEKIGLKMDPYTILGMCNPHLASRVIAAEPNIGLFLPCNVLIAWRGDLVEGTQRTRSLWFPGPATKRCNLSPRRRANGSTAPSHA